MSAPLNCASLVMEETLHKSSTRAFPKDSKLETSPSQTTPEKPGLDDARLHGLETKLLETLSDTRQFYGKMSSVGMRPQYNHPITLVMGVFDFKEADNGKIIVTPKDSAPWNNAHLSMEERIKSLEWYTKTTNTLIELGKLSGHVRLRSPLNGKLTELKEAYRFLGVKAPPKVDDNKDIGKTEETEPPQGTKKALTEQSQKSIPKQVPIVDSEKAKTFKGRAESILDHDRAVLPSSLQDSKALVEDMRKSLRRVKSTDSNYSKVAEDWMRASEALLRAFEDNPKLFEDSYDERRSLSRALYGAAIALEKSSITEKPQEPVEKTPKEPPKLMPLETQNLYDGKVKGWSFAQSEVFTKGARDSFLATASPAGIGVVGANRVDEATSLQVSHVYLDDTPFTFIGVSRQLAGSERNGTRISVGLGQEGDRFGSYLSFDRRDTVPLDKKGGEFSLNSQVGLPPSGTVNGNFELGVRSPTTYNPDTRLTSGFVGTMQADLGGINGFFLGEQERKAVQAIPTVPMDRYVSSQYGVGTIRVDGTGSLTPGLMGALGTEGRFKNTYYYLSGEGFLGTNGKFQLGVRAGIDWVVDKKSGLRIGIGTSFGRTFTPGGFDLPVPIRLGGLPFSITFRL